MPIDTRHRTSDAELLDDFSLAGDDLAEALDKIASINQWLGGNRVTLDGIEELLKNRPTERTYTILDIGCGNGDMCRAIARLGQKRGLSFRVVGIDANAFAVNYARQCSTQFSTVSYQIQDVFNAPANALSCDIAVCTLTLHHFSNPEILNLMQQFTQQARLGVVINDLQRSALAYRLFQLVAFVFRLSDLNREDGLTSILRGFKKDELRQFSRQLGLKNVSIRWRWAFRYQWIIRTLCP